LSWTWSERRQQQSWKRPKVRTDQSLQRCP
jgi:hypothetical protein